jgi:hypothetical protein
MQHTIDAEASPNEMTAATAATASAGKSMEKMTSRM